jgi:CRISPR-associated protein Csb2
LRCPAPGTFADLERKHRQFLGRLETGTFRPVAPLARFDLVPFARATEGAPPPYVAFRLLEPTTGDHLWLDPPRRTRDVAAWVRHATADVSEGWPFGSTSLLVHGHRETSGSNEGDSARLFFLPLPTINPRLGRVEGITRVMVVGRPGLEEQLAWIGSRLAGYQVEWQGEPVAMLEPLATGDWVLGRYLGSGLTWSSVTPVVLPGHDDRSGSKAERLLRKALLQAGLEPELVDGIRDLDWRKAGFWKGTALASRYLPPDKVSGPMFHVRLRFSKPVVGPLALGSGRFRGMGVFARD